MNKPNLFFPTPVWTLQLDEYQSINEQMYKFIKITQSKDQQGISKSNIKGWHSKDFNMQENEPKNFIKFILPAIEQVITDIKELLSEDKPVGYLFKDPEKIAINKPFLVQEDVIDNSVEVSLSSWIILSNDREMAVPTDWVVTVVDPIDSVLKMYKEKVNGKDYKVPSAEDG